MRFGCVWFNDFGTEGWSSIAGEEACLIHGTQDLSSDVMWVTNLNWEGMREKSILKHPRFKQEDFLRVKLSTIAAELDIKNDGDIVDRVRVLSEIIDRVCRLSQSIFGVTQFDKDLPTTIRNFVFAEKDERSYGAPIVDYAIKDAFHAWQRCETPPPQGSNFYSWRFPRMDYAGYLLNFAIPTNKWKKVDMKGKDAKLYIEENLSRSPMLCKIVIKRVNNPDFGQIMPFGYGVNRQRVWAAGQEVLHYMQYADVEVVSMLASDGFRELRLNLPEFDDLTGKMSISMGMLAECCWKSLANKPTPRGVWYTSWDRISLSKTALKLTQMGIPVMSYGSGVLTMSIHQSQYDYVFTKCLELGLTPPLNMLSHMEAA